MRIINKRRGAGKTTALIYTSYVMGYPILTFSRKNISIIQSTASQLGLTIPEPICIEDVLSGKFAGGIPSEVLVDESLMVLDTVLNWFNIKPVAVTLTAKEE